MAKERLIALYLPQFYPTKENDEWWHKGFTEWTNVGKAKPLFKNHYQPKIPADLGYYDLRLPEVRENQAVLAKEAGIEGFCYWHYWFAGRRLLDRIFSEVVESGKPDYPFCLCWANHSWYQKTWDPTKPDKLLIEQTYPGKQDFVNHFNALLPAFKDIRYMRKKGKLIFGIFDSDSILQFPLMKEVWNELAQENGLEGFYFFGLCQGAHRLENTLNKGYDAIVYEHMNTVYNTINKSWWDKLLRRYFKKPITLDYSIYIDQTINFFENHKDLTPCLVPNFDHSPRSLHNGLIMVGSEPQKWLELCVRMKNLLASRNEDENLVFIKSWNEWGEGNYLEPDLKYGKGFIEATRKAFDID